MGIASRKGDSDETRRPTAQFLDLQVLADLHHPNGGDLGPDGRKQGRREDLAVLGLAGRRADDRAFGPG